MTDPATTPVAAETNYAGATAAGISVSTVLADAQLAIMAAQTAAPFLPPQIAAGVALAGGIMAAITQAVANRTADWTTLLTADDAARVADLQAQAAKISSNSASVAAQASITSNSGVISSAPAGTQGLPAGSISTSDLKQQATSTGSGKATT